MAVTIGDIREECPTSLSDDAINRLICVVDAKMGACLTTSYDECLADTIKIYAVCHMIESTQYGAVTSKRAPNGASTNYKQYGAGEGAKSTPHGRLLAQIDTAGCYQVLIPDALTFVSIGNPNSPVC
jgi:hypothetical protein